MEFKFYISTVVQLDEQGFGLLDARKIPTFNKNYYPQTYSSYSRGQQSTQKDDEQNLAQLINQIGEASSIAQGLKNIITQYEKFVGTDNRLYVKAEGKKLYGILKVGIRNLFYRDNNGQIKELKPLCVLDFYVHSQCQRSGIGKQLFDRMLEFEQITPEKMAYDRPSPKLLGFLKKYYNLVNYIPQNNNFVIFQQFFEKSGSCEMHIRQQQQNQQKQQQQQSLTFNHSESSSNMQQQRNYRAQSRDGNKDILDYQQVQDVNRQTNHGNQQQHQNFASLGKTILQTSANQNDLNQQNIKNENVNLPPKNQQSFKGQSNLSEDIELKRQKQYVIKQQVNDFNRENITPNYQTRQNQKLDYLLGSQQKQIDEEEKIVLNNMKQQKDAIQMQDHQQKMKQTEQEIAQVSNQIEQLQLETQVSQKSGQQKLSTPWAATGLNQFYTTSRQYGQHYNVMNRTNNKN